MAANEPIDRTALGLTAAIVWAGAVVVLGITSRIGWGDRWRRLLADVYVGYDESLPGLVVGAVWAAVDGFVGGWLVATVYDRLAGS